MASKHPLDVFRSSTSGFDLASRRLRTIQGRVIGSRAREDLGLDDEDDLSDDIGEEPMGADEQPEMDPADDTPFELTAPRIPEQEPHEQEAPAPVDPTPVAPVAAASPAAPPQAEASPARGQDGQRLSKKARRRRRKAEARAAASASGPVAPVATPVFMDGVRWAFFKEPAAVIEVEESVEPAMVAPVAERTRTTAPTTVSEAPPEPSEPDLDRVPTMLVTPGRSPLLPPTIPVQQRGNLKALSQVLLYGSCLVIVVLMVWIGVQHDWSDGTDPLNKAAAAEVLDAGPGAAGSLLAGGEWFTVQAASYSPSDKGRLAAFDAHDALLARGYQHVLVTGEQTVDDSGELRLTTCVLLVGKRRDRSRLETVLASLGAIDDWPTGAASPFEDARIVSHPNPDGL
jgi:hypothetical protein